MYRRENDLRFLKFFVYLMGFILMAGAILLTYAIYKKQGIILTGSKNLPQTSCSNTSIDLELNGGIQQVFTASNNTIVIVSKNIEDSQEVLLVDYCSGKVLNRFKLNTTHNSVSLENSDYPNYSSLG